MKIDPRFIGNIKVTVSFDRGDGLSCASFGISNTDGTYESIEEFKDVFRAKAEAAALAAVSNLFRYMEEEITYEEEYTCDKCGKPGSSPHSCPYQSDVNEDNNFLCNCCDDCMQNCLDDI